MSQRTADVERNTNETQIQVSVNLDGSGSCKLETGVPFLEHMLEQVGRHGLIDIEIIAWDQPGAAVAMESGLTPQEAIAQGLPKPEECDLAVVVLWSRIGTLLPTDFEMKPDGTPYLSGTE